MAKRKRLTRREAHRLALHYAICERDSFAEANRPGEPARDRAEFLAAEFRRVLRDEFGEQTWEDDLASQDIPSISLSEIIGGPEHG